ncbi:hypothetical protein AAVH_17091 [Aphelenchoides avenae]|nr:hypothetical protein AAVH_17091 [Aphelenchus avenae]
MVNAHSLALFALAVVFCAIYTSAQDKDAADVKVDAAIAIPWCWNRCWPPCARSQHCVCWKPNWWCPWCCPRCWCIPWCPWWFPWCRPLVLEQYSLAKDNQDGTKPEFTVGEADDVPPGVASDPRQRPEAEAVADRGRR